MNTPDCSPCCNPPLPVNVPGPSGLNGFTTVTNIFTIPAQFSTVNVTVDNAANLILNQNVFIGSYNTNGANFLVTAINSPTSITLEYIGYAGDLAVGSVIVAGAIIESGTGNLPSYASQSSVFTTAPFNLPNQGSAVAIAVNNTSAFTVGTTVFLGGINWVITAVGSSTAMTILPLAFPADQTILGAGGTIASASVITPGTGNGALGVAGSSLTLAFQRPSTVGGTNTATVLSSAPFQVGMNVCFLTPLFAENYLVTAVPNTTQVTLKRLGFFGDASVVLGIGAFLSAGIANITSFGIQQNISASGTTYALTAVSLTATTPQITFGTTTPALTITQPGTYLFTARLRVDQVAADWTSAAQRTVTLQMSDVTDSTVIDTTVALFKSANATATTSTIVDATLMGVVTCAASDSIQLQGIIDAVPQTSGSVNVMEAVITAVRLY